MVEGYIVYKLFYYASEYIRKIDDTLGELVWEEELDEDKREEEPTPNEWKKVHDKE